MRRLVLCVLMIPLLAACGGGGRNQAEELALTARTEYLAAPEITGDMTPASLSHDLVTGVLREQLGFRGLVVTDSMEMGAVTGDYGPGEAAVAAILAGCDVVLMPGHLREVFDAVLAAVEDGTISQARLDESVRRVLEYKL